MNTNTRELDEDVAERVVDLLDEFTLEDTQRSKVDNDAGGTGLIYEDDLVVGELIKYKYSIKPSGEFPGTISMDTLQNVPYDADTEFAKRTKTKKETYFAKFHFEYKIGTNVYRSKYVGVQCAYLDMIARPETYNGSPNGFAKEYVAIYMSSKVVNQYKTLIESAGYLLDNAGINIDRAQSLVSFNANYSTEQVPKFTVHRVLQRKNEDGEEVEVCVIDQTNTIETAYVAIRGGGGVIFRGFAFGEFGVSKSVPVGGNPPGKGGTLKLTFKLLGFHVFSKCETVRAIKSKSSKPRLGV